jgi:putative phosphoesterase
MFVGILSDTHDRVDAMAAAMKLLRDGGAEFYVHCGDVGSERVLDHLAGVPCAFVFGNTDWDRAALARYAERIGVACHGAFADLELGGKKFAVVHGDDFKLKQRLLAEQKHDYLLQGHTHVRADQRVAAGHRDRRAAVHHRGRGDVTCLSPLPWHGHLARVGRYSAHIDACFVDA